MDNATLLALANMLPKQAKRIRADVEPGEYAVDDVVTFQVQGSIRVSEDETYTPTTHLPTKVVLALFMRYSGVTGVNAERALVRAMTEALELSSMEDASERKSAETAIRELADLSAAEERVRSSMDALPRQRRRGKVNVQVTIVAEGETD